MAAKSKRRRRRPAAPTFDRRLKRLVTEREARRVRKHGKIAGIHVLNFGKVILRVYRGATFHEFVRTEFL